MRSGSIQALLFPCVFLLAGACGSGSGAAPAKTQGDAATSDGSGGSPSEGGKTFDAGPPPADPCIAAGNCQPGVWVNVTPASVSLDPNFSCSTCNYGAQDIVVDPVHPAELYAFICYQGVWKSSDYGLTWAKVDTGTNSTIIESGRPWTAAIDPNPNRDPSTSPTLWTVDGYGTKAGVFKSTDGGINWSYYTVGNAQAAASAGYPQAADDAYSFDVDPNDSNHLICGFHQATGISESTDGGETWTTIMVPSNIGISLYPFFVNTGTASTTRTTWLTQAQWDSNVNGIWLTANSGGSWTQVQASLEHLHGSAQIFQDGMGHIYAAGQGSTLGVWRSADYGQTWAPANANGVLQNVVFGTATTLYAMSSGATQDTQALHDQKSPLTDGVNWSDWDPTSPAGMSNGPKRAAVTNDGVHYVIVAGNWLAGIWRYVEP
jgi:hypothetical protein